MITCDCGEVIEVPIFDESVECPECKTLYELEWDSSITDEGDENIFFLISSKTEPQK